VVPGMIVPTNLKAKFDLHTSKSITSVTAQELENGFFAVTVIYCNIVVTQSSQCKLIYFVVCRGDRLYSEGHVDVTVVPGMIVPTNLKAKFDLHTSKCDRGNGFTCMQIEFSFEIGRDNHTRNHGHIHMPPPKRPSAIWKIPLQTTKYMSLHWDDWVTTILQ
jgi:hypothetical protein